MKIPAGEVLPTQHSIYKFMFVISVKHPLGHCSRLTTCKATHLLVREAFLLPLKTHPVQIIPSVLTINNIEDLTLESDPS